MKFRVAALAPIIYASFSGLHAAGPPPPLYAAVEVDRFVPDRGVAFPSDHQSALAEQIAREISLTFPTVIIVPQGDATPTGHALLRISGVVQRFKPFSAGAALLKAQVWFIDGTTGQVLLNREVQGITEKSLAGKIVRTCNAAHLIASN